MNDSAFSVHKYCTLSNAEFTYQDSQVNIENNIVENCTDVAVHLNANEKVTVKANNNTIINSGEYDEDENKTYIMVFANLTGSNVTSLNNTLDGNKLSEISNFRESTCYICK